MSFAVAQSYRAQPPTEQPANDASGDALALSAFLDACDATRTSKETQRLLVATARARGFEHVLLATHGGLEQLGELAVLAHDLDDAAIELFLLEDANPVFIEAERTEALISWDGPEFRARLKPADRVWLSRLAAEHGLGHAVTQRVRTSLAPASCTLFLSGKQLDLAQARWTMRAAAYAFHHIVALQRPQLAPSAQLTLREQQCLTLATLSGLRPREVAENLGVSIHTVRTMRQSASARLGARSPEEAVWRMLATGQLLARGRVRRPRTW